MYLRWVSLNFGTLFHHLFCNLPTKENKNKNLSCDLLNRNWDFTRTICSQQINVYLPNRMRTWYSYLIIHLYLKRLPLKKRLLLDTVRTWLDFSNLCENCDLHDLWNSDSHYALFAHFVLQVLWLTWRRPDSRPHTSTDAYRPPV